MSHEPTIDLVVRRAFLQQSILILGACTLNPNQVQADYDSDKALIKLGLVTDLHYADKPQTGSRYYRETPDKLSEAAAYYKKNTIDFIVELGDLIDAADSVETELAYLKVINQQFSQISKNRHYVLGNHCVDTLTKTEFLTAVGQEKSYYSFDHQQFHFLILDSCFNHKGQPYGRKNFTWEDANIHPDELAWIKEDLEKTEKPTIVFAHQRMDIETKHGVKNNATVRQLFEDSGKVLAVFQGHSHDNDLKTIKNIHYCTLVAMVEGAGAENNGYSLLEIFPDKTLILHGFRNQKNYNWK